ncbi:hypothetical protein [Sphingomonas sp.]|jgi:hypothetical protein|uniref:hypothetical protein n=1 Tax=Sphingomonas sp. TaxID=28214 RepID=UPI002EDB7F11
MSRIVFAAAAASLAFAGPALADERQLTRDGVTYNYTIAKQGDARILAGTASLGGRFRLVVKDGWVRGHVGSTPVSFAEPKRTAQVTVASR